MWPARGYPPWTVDQASDPLLCPHRCLVLGTRPTSTSMPWASTWTSGWSSSAPSGSLSWGWAMMMGSECPPPRPTATGLGPTGAHEGRGAQSHVSTSLLPGISQGTGRQPPPPSLLCPLLSAGPAPGEAAPDSHRHSSCCPAPRLTPLSSLPAAWGRGSLGRAHSLLSPAWRRTSSRGESSSGRPCASTLGWKPLEKSPGECVPADWAGAE